MKTSGAAGRKLEKLDALTSLRFFAAAMIVIGHGVLDFGEAGFFYPFANLFTTSQGVSLFFVLSGFILAYAYPELPTFSHVKKFFIARFARIWPAHIFALILLFVAIQDVSYLNLSSDKLGQVILANVLLIHAWIPYKDFYESLNVVSWSISTEFFFYFLFPIFLYKWHHTWHIKLALVFLLWVGVLMFANDGLPIASTAGKLNVHGLIYINPLTRLLEFTVGIAFCGLYKILKPTSNTLSRSSATFLEIGVLLCVFFSMWASAVLANSSSFQLQFGSAAVYWLKTCGGFLSFALLILILAFQRGWISRILQNKWLVLLGEISFSLYLVHTFFLKYIRVYLKDFSFIDPSILYVIYWIVGITLAYLMYQVVEKPCRTYIVSFSREKTIGGHFYIPERDKNSFIFSLLVLSFIIVFLMIFKPTIIHFESKEKAVQLSQLPGNLLASPALFNNSLSLISLKADKIKNNQLKVSLLWKSESSVNLKYKVAVHFLNKEGQIVGMTNYVESGKDLQLDREHYWSEFVIIPSARAKTASKIAIVLFERDANSMANLYTVNGIQTDWGHHRLIVTLLGQMK